MPKTIAPQLNIKALLENGFNEETARTLYAQGEEIAIFVMINSRSWPKKLVTSTAFIPPPPPPPPPRSPSFKKNAAKNEKRSPVPSPATKVSDAQRPSLHTSSNIGRTAVPTAASYQGGVEERRGEAFGEAFEAASEGVADVFVQRGCAV